MQLIFYHLSLVCNWNQEPGYSNLKIRFWYYTGSNILKSLLCSNPLHLIKELVLQDLLLQVSAALEKGINPKSPHFLCTKLVQVQSDRSAGVRSCSQATSEETGLFAVAPTIPRLSLQWEKCLVKKRRVGKGTLRWKVRPRITRGIATKRCSGTSLPVIQHCQGCSTRSTRPLKHCIFWKQQ